MNAGKRLETGDTGARLRRQTRIVELFDRESAGDALSAEEFAEYVRLIYETEQDHPNLRKVTIPRLFMLEEVFRETGNGAAAWEALRISAEAGWPKPPGWVLTYLSDVSIDVLLAVTSDAGLRRALRLRVGIEERSGGPSARRRLDTQIRRREAVGRMCDVIDRLREADEKFVRAGTPGVPGAFTVEDARATNQGIRASRAWRERLPPELLCGKERAETAARIVAWELASTTRRSGASPAWRTLLNWFSDSRRRERIW